MEATSDLSKEEFYDVAKAGGTYDTPSTWDPVLNPSAFQLYPLRSNSVEYKEVYDSFNNSKPRFVCCTLKENKTNKIL